jgi:hypothetical protein
MPPTSHVFLLEVMALIYQKAFELLPTKQPMQRTVFQSRILFGSI